MSYTVIARAWRPRKFEDVVGQPHITTTLKNSIQSGRISHAYLFTGPRGVGKTSMARILAKAVNCLKGLSAEPCDVCENCIAINSGNFVDVIEIDAASKTGVDEMRELTESVHYMPMRGIYKVYILDESHMLSRSAVSALLKTLEEPPGHNIFILATTEAQKIPYTIMSRCQRFDFRRIPEKDIIEQLKKICSQEGIGYDEGVFQYIAVEADGSLRDAESMLDQIIGFSGKYIAEKDVINIIGVVERDILYKIIRSIFDCNLKEGLELIEKTLGEGYDIHQIYRGLVSFLRNMMLIKVCGGVPSFLYIGEEELKRVSGLLEGVEYYEIQNMLHYMLKAEDLLKGLFPKVSLEILYINLYNLSRLRDVERVIDDLGQRGHSGVQEAAGSYGEPVVRETAEPQTAKPQTAEPPCELSAQGFVEYVKKKKPFIGGVFENLQVQVEQDSFIVFLDKRYSGILKTEGDEVKRLLREFFGRDMTIQIRDAGQIKKNILDDFVKEAESLFNV
ncbi:MAG TPA: DNA polymerase III subunit gamma/tau [Syntrophorhabdaceae bacterium]|nr:DNA polymerase III subunit gamma/tau [Syntrophorhabdaceae bacterium]HQM82109.1 DNA polymerase III subunit gamma/tau [Syntrophorhabdaceae bacterium]